MTSDMNDDIDLSVLAPPIQSDEALSSWLVRVADAHLITVAELERYLGGPVAGLDRGELTLSDAGTGEARDIVLEAADFDAVAMIKRVWRSLEPDGDEKRLVNRLRLRWAVRDVVDALAANRREPRGGLTCL